MKVLEGVLVYHTRGLDEDLGSQLHGCSGVAIGNNWVLTHGTALHPGAIGALNFMKTMASDEMAQVPTQFTRGLLFRVLTSDGTFTEGSVAVVWACSALKATLGDLARTWASGRPNHLGPVFMVIKLRSKPEDVQKNSTILEAKKVLSGFYERYLIRPVVGQPAEIVSSPFGSAIFLNSVTRGVISNVIGLEGCLFTSDACTIAGSEGAPVYVTHENGQKYIAGLVIGLSYDEPQGYTFAASIRQSLSKILKDTNEIHTIGKTRNYENVTKIVVAVNCGPTWGTGVIVNKKSGTILTCAHVVENAARNGVKVRVSEGVFVDAKLVFATPAAAPFDAAVLEIDPEKMKIDHSLRDAAIDNGTIALQGEAVAVVGYPFSPETPSISLGNIAKISEHALSTTCCVQNGNSGGPVLRWPTGELLGIVVCNVICPINGKTRPRMNLALPFSVLSGPLQKYIETKDPTVLEALECNEKSARDAWELNFPPRAKL